MMSSISRSMFLLLTAVSAVVVNSPSDAAVTMSAELAKAARQVSLVRKDPETNSMTTSSRSDVPSCSDGNPYSPNNVVVLTTLLDVIVGD